MRRPSRRPGSERCWRLPRTYRARRCVSFSPSGWNGNADARLTAIVRFAGDRLNIYDPASTWQVPEPLALAESLSCFAQDSPELRRKVAWSARRQLLQWCGTGRVRRLLRDELEHLGIPM